jgi:enoyl-CoA hydratase
MTDDILFERDGSIATMTLNRPKALNALTLPMIMAMGPQLEEWASDDAVKAVVIQGAGDRAFCAGGDVPALRKSIMVDNDGQAPSELSRTFFFEEYKVNHLIATYPKPYVALLDGVTMGGGVGMSVYGSRRVATERLMLAMPETAIGLFPDVGGGWFLAHLPGETGVYLGLTGSRVHAADAMALGITTHHMASERVAEMREQLTAVTSARDIDEVLARFHRPAGIAPISEHRREIDRCFAGNTMEEIIGALKASGSEFATKALESLAPKSPSALKVSLEQIRRGRKARDLGEVLTMEYRMSQHFMAEHDFHEGVRAMLIDKDHSPQWKPASLEEVSESDVAGYFEPIADGSELTFG